MADIDLINDELERVYQLYGERSRQFRRALYVLIVAGLAVFALLVVPFLTFRDQLAVKQAEVAALANELDRVVRLAEEAGGNLEDMTELRGDVHLYGERQRSYEVFTQLQEETAAHAEELAQLRAWAAGSEDAAVAAWVRGEADRPPEDYIRTSRLLASRSRDPCFWKHGEAYKACRLCEGFKEEHRYFAHRVSQLTALSEDERTTAADALGALVERACGWLVGGEMHWARKERPQPEGRGSLRGMFSVDLHAYEERIVVLQQRMRDLPPAHEETIQGIKDARAAASERLNILEAQLGRIAGFDRIGTPVGDLPLGLGQLVLLFPVVLALAFLVVANSYAGSVELQHAFVRLCRKRDSAEEVMDRAHIAAIAPLWLDRGTPLATRSVRWAILLTPLALMLVNLALIAGTSALTALLPDDSAIPPLAYIVLYVASLVLFAGTLWHVHRSGREAAGDPLS
jgi:hypothetical protein